MVELVVTINNLNVIRANHHCRNTQFRTEAHHLPHFILRNNILAHYLFAISAECARGENVSVHERFHFGNIVEQLPRATRSREYLHALFSGTAQCVACGLRYIVCLEAHERAINIEEQGFYHSCNICG